MIDFSVILAGFGGQGILSAGKMAAEAALFEAGYNRYGNSFFDIIIPKSYFFMYACPVPIM